MKITNKISEKLSLFKEKVTNIYIYIYIYIYMASPKQYKKGGCLLTRNNLSLKMEGGYC